MEEAWCALYIRMCLFLFLLKGHLATGFCGVFFVVWRHRGLLAASCPQPDVLHTPPSKSCTHHGIGSRVYKKSFATKNTHVSLKAKVKPPVTTQLGVILLFLQYFNSAGSFLGSQEDGDSSSPTDDIFTPVTQSRLLLPFLTLLSEISRHWLSLLISFSLSLSSLQTFLVIFVLVGLVYFDTLRLLMADKGRLLNIVQMLPNVLYRVDSVAHVLS